MHRNLLPSVLCSSLLLLGISGSVCADDDAPPQRTTLKVCADPHYMPFSSKEQAGYENRLANLLGDALKIPVEYTWFPQRMGFIRNTLRKETENGDGYLCDLVVGVPTGYELTMTTQSYLQSTYALVTVTGGKLADLQKPADLANGTTGKQPGLRIGVTERSPGADWLAKYGLYTQMEPYIAQSGNPNEYPGQPMLEDMLSGKLDAAIVWGPTAAYFARQATAEKAIKVLPLESEPGARLHFSMSMGVRFGEGPWKKQLNQLLEANKDKVQLILNEYGIPLVDDNGKLLPSS